MQKVLLHAVAVFFLGLAVPAFAQTQNDVILVAIEKAAGRLVALQWPDGGWPAFSLDQHCGVGNGKSCPDTRGIDGLGLVYAYQEKHVKSFLEAAVKAAAPMVKNPSEEIRCEPARSAMDAAFLFELSRFAGDGQKYADTARRLWRQCIKADHGQGFGRSNYHIDTGRIEGKEMDHVITAFWEMFASLTTGEKTFAQEMATVMANRRMEWYEKAGNDQPFLAALFLTMTPNMDNVNLVSTFRGHLAMELLKFQSEDDGSWNGSWGQTYTTAFAVMGLGTVVPTDEETNLARQRGVDFLRFMQKGPLKGGFLFLKNSTKEFIMADSVAIWALANFQIISSNK